ncbi:hypothetical protein SHPE106448_12845 [Shewanella pealeana]
MNQCEVSEAILGLAYPCFCPTLGQLVLYLSLVLVGSDRPSQSHSHPLKSVRLMGS